MDVMGFVGIDEHELECLGGARCGLGCEEVYWPAYLRKFGVIFECF